MIEVLTCNPAASNFFSALLIVRPATFGTTAVVAKKLGRHYIGIDREQQYIHFAEQRLNNTEKSKPDYLVPCTKEIPPKIAFGDLVAANIIPPGTILYDPKGKHNAVVMADGSVKSGKKQASIHQLAAILKNSPTCNGWTFWHIKNKNQLFPIDIFREIDKIGLNLRSKK